MKNGLALVFALAFSTSMLCAQTTNFALNNADGSGKVSVFTITELNDNPEATFQMWVKPTAQTTATLIGQDNFSIELENANQLLVKSGSSVATASVGDLMNKWSQLTITVKNGAVKAFVNNTEVSVSETLPETFAATQSAITEKSCVIAEGLNGQIDEIRVWSRALEQDDFFWNNTLNKFNPNYDALVAYWKCDQDQCENLVDYKSFHHGVFDNISREAVTDNSILKYRVVTGYTNLMRFTDRPNINRDMFLMTNDLILLSAKVQQDGSLWMEYPDNTATPTNVNYIEEFEGHTGVMDFQGVGAQMVAADARIPFDPTSTFGHGDSQKATIEGWIYIDTWNEGAAIYSNYAAADNCVVIKLGSEADKEILVDLCGTVASLKNEIEVGKWQYLAVYLTPTKGALTSRFTNPIQIAIGEMDGDGTFTSTKYTKSTTPGVTLSGNDVAITAVPSFYDSNSTLVLGKDFDGKMDEIKVWGSERGGIAGDATTPYQWNVGVWDNIFLNAYWKGDDPDNIGKDSQSYLGIIEFIQNYYKNYRGYKIRLGLIYPDGTKWVNNVLNKEEYVDNLIRDAKVIVKECDGLDVDLEWMYSTSDWNVYNNVISRLINEVMVDYPEKIFSCSLHAVSYNGFNKGLLDDVDYFTFQLYGPQTSTYVWDYYSNAYNSFKNYGYPDDKILLSYGILLVGNGEEGYKDLFEKYGMNDENYDPDLNTWNCNGTTKYFNGVNQTKRKQEYIIEHDCRGTMYFDMGNDQRVDDYKSLIRAQNDIIASNVDTLITEVDMTASAIEHVSAAQKSKMFTVYTENTSKELHVVLADNSEPVSLEVYSIEGRKVKQYTLVEKINVLSCNGLQAGIYLAKGRQGNKDYTVKFVIH